jgi:hypothetical protein
MIWDFGAFAFLYWLASRRKIRSPGIFWLYVAAYSGFRIFEETQRIDYSNYFLGMRVNFWIASVLCLVSLVFVGLIQRGFRGWGTEPAALAPPGTRYGPNPKRHHQGVGGSVTATANASDGTARGASASTATSARQAAGALLPRSRRRDRHR